VTFTKLYICPGIHQPSLTQSFLNGLRQTWGSAWSDRLILGVLPATVPPYAPRLVLDHFEACLGNRAQGLGSRGEGVGNRGDGLVWIGFSAGVVGALLAARQWHRQGHPVQALIAVDGWGVPLWADFPVYSLSPDRLAYETTRGLRSKHSHFYADPPVSHLALWEQPQKAIGWVECPGGKSLRLTAAEYIERIYSKGGLVG
jgi:hypothetical protein